MSAKFKSKISALSRSLSTQNRQASPRQIDHAGTAAHVGDEAGKHTHKEGDNERVLIMNMVKSGNMSIDNALHAAYGLGVASTPYEWVNEIDGDDRYSLERVYNFGVHRYTKVGAVKSVLQLDFQEQIMCFIVKGIRQMRYTFQSIRSVESEDGSTKLNMLMKDRTDLELDADSLEEKNQLVRLLDSVLEQSLADQQSIVTSVADTVAGHSDAILKEDCLEKKGHSAASLVWSKRFVRIQLGKLLYYKVGDERNPDAALNIVKLGPGLAIAKRVDANGFLVVTNKKEYSFRIPSGSGQSVQDVQRERDDWIIAIQEASRPKLSVVESQGGDTTHTPLEQESFLKNMIRTLQEQLEQLQAIFSIMDAPVRATVQVRKIRETVEGLDEQLKLGLLSWTLKAASPVSPLQLSSGGPFGASKSICESGDRTTNDSYSTLERSFLLPDPARPFSWADDTADRQASNVYVEAPLNDANPGVVVATSPPSRGKRISQRDARKQYMQSLSLERNKSPTQSLHDVQESSGCGEDSDLRSGKATNVLHADGASKDTDADLIGPCPNELNKSIPVSPSTPGPITSAVNSGTTSQMDVDHTRKSDVSPTGIPAAPPPPGSAPISTNGVPVAPPLPGNSALGLPPKQDFHPSKKLKSFFWNKVPDRLIKDSVWKSFEDTSACFDLKLLESMFEVRGGTSVRKISKQSTLTGSESLLNSKKAQNVGIFLSGFKLKFSEIETRLMILGGDECLPLEHIVSLKRFKPTAEECELYKHFSGDESALQNVDQFMLALSRISYLEEKLDILLAAVELPEQFSLTNASVETILESCQTLKNNTDFCRMLQYILTVGNFINGGTARGCAYGFTLNSLVKVIDVRTTDQTNNLLQFIVGQLFEKDLGALKCYESSAVLLSPQELSLKGLGGEVEVMKKALAKLESHMSVLCKSADQSIADKEFTKKTQLFLTEYEEKCNNLMALYKEVETMSKEILRVFGENASFNFQEWLQNVSSFLQMLQLAVNDEEQRRKRKSHRPSAHLSQLIDESTSKDTIMAEVATMDHNLAHVQKQQPARETTIVREQEQHTDHTMTASSREDVEKCKSTKDGSANGSDDVTESSLMISKGGVVKQGLLEKLSGGKHRAQKWDKRLFELMDTGYLYYYKKPGDKKPAGTIYLPGCPVMQDFDDPSLISIETEEREWSFKAATPSEAREWTVAILHFTNRGS